MHKRTRNLSVLFSLILVLLSQMVQLSRSEILGPVITPTITPWVKQDILIKMLPSGMKVWTDNAEVDRLVIDKIEGVLVTMTFGDGHEIFVRVDPRYDRVLVAEAIMNRLTKNITRQEGQIG